MQTPKCSKTISGEHIWNEGNYNGIDTMNVEVKHNFDGNISYVELVRCRACGLVDDRALFEKDKTTK